MYIYLFTNFATRQGVSIEQRSTTETREGQPHSFTSRKVENTEELRDGAYGLSSLSKKTMDSNHLQM